MFLLYKLPKTFFVLVSILLFSVPAFALSADDFIPPAQAKTETQKEQLSTVQNETAVHTEKDENLGVEVVKAATLQDSINSIVNRHKQGCTTADPSNDGVTFVATGTGSYNPNYRNVIASRTEQRNAYVIAFMNAKSAMAQFVGQIVFRGADNFETRHERITNPEKTMHNLDTDLSDEQIQSVRKVLKGYVTYSVFDDGQGKVYVSIVSSPKTRGKYSRMGDNEIQSDSISDGLNELISEIKNNLVPPVGGRIITTNDGQVAWVGFGSAVVDKDEELDVQAELDLEAERTADARAVDALAGIILGDDTMWQRRQNEQTKKQVHDFERLQQNDQTTKGTAEEIRAHNDRVRNMRNATASTTNVRSLRNGVLPPGIVRHTEIDENGYFAYGIAVYSPRISAKVNEASREMDEAQIVQPLNNGRDSNSEIIQRGSNRQKLNLQMMKGPSGIVKQDL